MRQESPEKGMRIDIPYFEGVNGSVGHVLSKKTELAHAENARSEIIGTVQKRDGQSSVGLSSSGGRFYTSGNYSLMYFENDGENSLYRISETPITNFSINVNDEVLVTEGVARSGTGATTFSRSADITIKTSDTISATEFVMDGVSKTANIYQLDKTSNQWNILSGSGTGIPAAKFSTVSANGKMFIVNGYSNNRYISRNGTTVVDSSSTSGDLFLSPNAKKVSFYKNRIYLANFRKDFTNYKTTVLRSSYPLGIVALVSEDISSPAVASLLKITDNKYISAVTGANAYEIWRGGTKICGITIDQVNEFSIKLLTITDPTTGAGGYSAQLLASDEIWIAGTFTGEKIYRWVGNPTSSGKDVKLYDTFNLTGGDNDEIKMMTPVGDVLMLGSNDSLATWNDYTLVTHDVGVGCVSFNGYIKSYGSLYFIHYTGVYSTSGGIPTLISQKVRRYIEGATKEGLENAAAGKKGKSIYFKIGDVTLYNPDGSVDKIMNDVALEYSIPENNWYVHTNVTGDEFRTYRTDENLDMLHMTGTKDAMDIIHFLDPNETTDLGVEIPFRIDINDMALQQAYENMSHPYSLIVESDRGASMGAFAKINREQYYKLDGLIKKGISVVKVHGRDTKRGAPPPARLFSVSIRDTSKQICKIDRLSILHIPTLSDDDNDQ